MTKSPAKIQAALALGFALLLWIAWSLFGTPLRVRWIVARGAPPAGGEASDAALEEIRAVGFPARSALLSILEGDGSRARKSWVASALLRAPFFASAEVEKAVSSPVLSTRRAAVFSLMRGEDLRESFEASTARIQPGGEALGKGRPRAEWDPGPAVPLLLEWLADAGDPEARFAARLLGTLPPGDDRVREALLRVVEETKDILGPGAGGERQLRKFVVVDSMQALLPWAKEDPSVVERVSKVVAWIDEEKLSDAGWDLQAYALGLVEVSRGKGLDPSLLMRLAKSPSPVLRQRLAGVIEKIPGSEGIAVLEYLVHDETATVRRSAALTFMKRLEPRILDLAPVLVEDCYIYVRSDALRAIGALRAAEPARCRALLPLLVSCIEEPWQGETAAEGTPMATFQREGRVDVVEAASLSLWQLASMAPGFQRKDPAGKAVNDIFDWRQRSSVARRIAEEPAFRATVVEEWRRTVPPRPEGERVRALVRRLLEDRDPENAVRAMRELKRLTGDDASFPPAAMTRKDDDAEARNAVREWWKQGGREKAREHWGRLLAE